MRKLRTGAAAPAALATADLLGSSGAAAHPWRRHGRCSRLSARASFALARRAVASLRLPPAHASPVRAAHAGAAEVEAAVPAANPGWRAGTIAVTCRDGRVREVRLCPTRALAPRRCGADALSDRRDPRARLETPP